MKFIVLSLLASSLSHSGLASVTPFQVSLESLFDSNLIQDDEAFMNVLTTTGLFSVTSLPESAKNAARTMIATQHECLMASSNTQEQVYPDGTVRVTLATHTVAGLGGMQALRHKTENVDACIRFEEASKVFRKTTQVVVSAFAEQLTTFLKNSEGPLLVTKETENEDAFSFKTFSDVVENGEHLEHFHSYTKNKSVDGQDITIEFHTDQGVFLVFTPGRLTTGELTDGFYIQTADGDIEQINFSDADDLVIMLGDGVNQFVNLKIEDSTNHLRAVPHAVQLDTTEYARIWYGLMVLPPSSAIHPQHGVSFGDIRQGLVSGNDDIIQLACSPTDSISNHRLLDGSVTTCNFTEEVYCWHRCMNATLFNASNAICESSSRDLKCVNPRNQIWSGENHGDYFPACADKTFGNETALPTLPEYPRDDSLCTNFEAFYDDDTYKNTMKLNDRDGVLAALFQYEVTVNDTVKGRLAYDGIFGYLSFGFRGSGGRLIMQNAPVVLAKPGGDYTAFSGLNLSLGPQVNEFITDINNTAFRHWSTPYVDEDDVTATERHEGEEHEGDHSGPYSVYVDADGCYTSLSFELKSIAGREFNLTGTDVLIWAANNIDYYMGYHGGDRGNWTVEWSAEVTTSDDTSTSASSFILDTGAYNMYFILSVVFMMIM